MAARGSAAKEEITKKTYPRIYAKIKKNPLQKGLIYGKNNLNC